MPRLLLVGFALVAILPGCFMHSSSFSVTQSTNVAAADGDDVASGTCDGDGNLSYSYTANTGSLSIRVTDSDGNVVRQTGSLAMGTHSDGTGLQGKAGTWMLTVQRHGFAGNYAVQVAC